jgi:hypothetical protein
LQSAAVAGASPSGPASFRFSSILLVIFIFASSRAAQLLRAHRNGGAKVWDKFDRFLLAREFR